MKFTVNEQTIPPVNITLSLDDYFGCKLPTLYANGIPILHILDDGRICMRSEGETNIKELENLGFATNLHHYSDFAYKVIKTIPSGELGRRK